MDAVSFKKWQEKNTKKAASMPKFLIGHFCCPPSQNEASRRQSIPLKPYIREPG
jgi:hypothetical protein